MQELDILSNIDYNFDLDIDNSILDNFDLFSNEKQEM